MANGGLARRGLAVAVGAVLVLGGCSSNGSGSNNNTPKPAPSPTTAKNTDAACSNVVTKGRALAATAGRFVGGQASASDLKTAANDFSTAVRQAEAALKPGVSQNLDHAQAGVQRLQKALTTQPVDKSEIGRAAAQVATSLGSAVNVCQTS
jgi:hypothetical protein